MAEVNLRAIEKSDLAMIQRWRNSPNVMPYCRQYRPLSVKDMENWYDSLSRDTSFNLTNDLFVIEYEGTPVGVGGLVRIDSRCKKGEVSFYIGDAEKCTTEIITECLLHLMAYAHQTLGLRKIYWPVYAFNPYLEIYEKLMPIEYVAHDEYYYNGNFYDRIVLASYGILG